MSSNVPNKMSLSSYWLMLAILEWVIKSNTLPSSSAYILLLVGKQIDWLPLSVTVPSLSRGCSASSFSFSSRSSSMRRRCGGRRQPITLRLRRVNPVPARPRTQAPRNPNTRWRSTPPSLHGCCGSHASHPLPHMDLCSQYMNFWQSWVCFTNSKFVNLLPVTINYFQCI